MKILRFAQNDSSRGIPQSEQPSVIQVLFLSHPEFSHLSFRLSEANGEIYTIL